MANPFHGPASAQAEKGMHRPSRVGHRVVGAALSADVDAPTERCYSRAVGGHGKVQGVSRRTALQQRSAIGSMALIVATVTNASSESLRCSPGQHYVCRIVSAE